jgi:hypothetical protein
MKQAAGLEALVQTPLSLMDLPNALLPGTWISPTKA